MFCYNNKFDIASNALKRENTILLKLFFAYENALCFFYAYVNGKLLTAQHSSGQGLKN